MHRRTAYVQVLMCRVCQIVGLNNYDLSYNCFYSIVMKQNKIRPEWAADRGRWFEIIQNVNPIVQEH